jgi:antitoxin component YwqK of YwqJK toxin-antitoxin module
MKRLLLIVLPLLLIVGCSQKPVEDTTLINKDGLMYTPDSDKPYTGEVFNNYSTGEKEYQGTYENGLLVTYSYLNKDGSVKEPVNGETLIDRSGLFYEVNGQKPYTGDVFELYRDGGRKYTGSLKGGKKDRLWTRWGRDGQKGYEETYKDGIKDGKSTTWYNNGQKKNESTYNSGFRYGLYTEWNENGLKVLEEEKEDGKMVSEEYWNTYLTNTQKKTIFTIDSNLAKILYGNGIQFVTLLKKDTLNRVFPKAIINVVVNDIILNLEYLIGYERSFVIYCSDDCVSSKELAYQLQDNGFYNILLLINNVQ